jgi:hypothetical protein
MNGFGIYTWPGGRKYIGCYVNDQKEGYGHYYWEDGRVYSGWWHNNKQSGPGKYLVRERKMAMKIKVRRGAEVRLVGERTTDRVVHT